MVVHIDILFGFISLIPSIALVYPNTEKGTDSSTDANKIQIMS